MITEIRVFNGTPMNILVGKLDYSKKIGNTKLEIRLKGTKTQFDNDVLVEDKIGEEWIPVGMFSSMANMTEKVLLPSTKKSLVKSPVKMGLFMDD